MVKFARRGGTHKRLIKKKTKQKAKLVKAIKKVVHKAKPKREERFYVDKVSATSTLAGALGSTVISNIAQGDQYNQRDGRKIYMSGVRVSLVVQSDSTVKTKFLRVMIVRNKAQNTNVLNTTTYANLLQDENFTDLAPTQTGFDATYPLNTSLLQIYLDKTYRILPEYNGAININRYVPIKKVFDYGSLGSGNTPTNGELMLVLMLCEGDNVTTTTTVNIRGMARVHYKDA